MRMNKSIILLIAGVLSVAALCLAANGDDILGVWNNEEKDAKIEIFKCKNRYCGRIVFAKEPNYPAGSTEGTPGSLRRDHNNPDSAKRSRLIIGLQIVNDFTFAGDSVYKDGTVYDPKNGKAYRGKMTLVSPNKLVMRGFVGIPLFGRSTEWTRDSMK